ncbi:uncharacterized protein LOC134877481 [Eleginops maclovinus]|uniref:uncharacterized protein LOC134877481 n=1 Tax=Eleginops maclovinus TaxID=56733 RepID=UPI00308055DD
MAGCLNTADVRVKDETDVFVKRLKEGPDLRVNKSIARFFSLASSDHLRQLYEKRKMQADDEGCFIRGMTGVVVKVRSGPEVTGLGALGIALYIDNCASSPPEDSTKEALRCVFAENTEMSNLIVNCLLHCVLFATEKHNLRGKIDQSEGQLSTTLTRLKNSIVSDGHMSPEALKAWVNGAAFHIQMLIHLVRMGGNQTCHSIETVLSAYQSDLDPLFKKLKEVIEAKCHMAPDATFLVDENSKKHAINPQGNYDKYLEVYYNHRYGRQKGEILQYFHDIRQNLQELVDQKGFFHF